MIALSILDGIITTLPLILVVYGGILLADILVSTGSLNRIGGGLGRNVKSKIGKALVLSFGLSNLLEGAGIVAEPLTAPVCYEEGFSPEEAATLSIWGYSALLTLEFAGIILTVLSLATEIQIADLIMPVTLFSLIGSSIMIFLLPVILEGKGWEKKEYILLGVAVCVLVFIVFLTARYIHYKISGVLGGVGVILAIVFLERRGKDTRNRGSLPGEKIRVGDILPYIPILVAYLGINMIPPVKEFVAENLSFAVEVVRSHTIIFSPLSDIYTYLFIAAFCAILAGEGKRGSFVSHFRSNFPKGARAALAMALFGAMGQIISFSGFDPSFSTLSQSGNVASIIAKGLFAHTGSFYLLFVPLLGWMGTFLTGYGVASIMLFGKLQVSIASLIGISPAIVASVLAVGAGVGSISSPFKVAIATPLCNGIGKEPLVLRKTIPAGVGVSILLGVILLLYHIY